MGPLKHRHWLVALAVLAVAAPATASSAKPQGAGTLVLRPHWRLLASGVQSVARDGRYAFFVGAYPAPSLSGTLVDEQTGKRRTVSEPECGFAAMGGGWLLFTCGPKLILYRLLDGHQQVVPPEPVCQGGVCSEEAVQAIGRYWIEWWRSAPIGPCCSPTSYLYQRLGTTQVVADPTTTATVPDLNTVSLVRKVCKPLKTPVSFNDHARGLGSLSFDGEFAFASTSLPPNPNPYFEQFSSGQETFLERCGTDLHQSIGKDPAFNAHVVLWGGTDGGPLIGLSLPGRRWFLVQLPAKIAPPTQLVLTANQQLVLDSRQRLWAAGAPRVAAR